MVLWPLKLAVRGGLEGGATGTVSRFNSSPLPNTTKESLCALATTGSNEKEHILVEVGRERETETDREREEEEEEEEERERERKE